MYFCPPTGAVGGCWSRHHTTTATTIENGALSCAPFLRSGRLYPGPPSTNYPPITPVASPSAPSALPPLIRSTGRMRALDHARHLYTYIHIYISTHPRLHTTHLREVFMYMMEPPLTKTARKMRDFAHFFSINFYLFCLFYARCFINPHFFLFLTFSIAELQKHKTHTLYSSNIFATGFNLLRLSLPSAKTTTTTTTSSH
eukprot:gene9819-6895_t